jgi:hypothetical protein
MEWQFKNDLGSLINYTFVVTTTSMNRISCAAALLNNFIQTLQYVLINKIVKNKIGCEAFFLFENQQLSLGGHKKLHIFFEIYNNLSVTTTL